MKISLRPRALLSKTSRLAFDRARLLKHIAGTVIGGEIDRPAALRATDTEAKEPTFFRPDGHAAGFCNRRRQWDLLRPPEERIDAPERAKIAHGEERVLLRRIGEPGEADVLGRVRI